jgi:hypothetical protein
LGSSSVGFPYVFNLLADGEQEHVSMAMNVAMLGYHDDTKDAGRNSAALSMGVVSSATHFATMPESARGFDLLEHTCMVGTNDEGSPIFNDRGCVIAIQSHSDTELIRVADKADPSKSAVKKFTVGNVKYAASARFLRDLVDANSGDSHTK